MNKIIYIIIIFIALFLLFSIDIAAQKATKIKIIYANALRPANEIGENVKKLIGDVVILHDSTYLYCDSAYFDEETNSFDGFGNVRIKVNDTLNIYSDLLDYDGNSRIAELLYNVRLISKASILTTHHLYYNRNTEIAYYLTGGKIVDSSNVLTSNRAYFYTSYDYAYFKDSVVLVNPDYVMNSDTMKYDTDTEISFFYGPTTITSDENIIYCENGWYDTQNDKSVLEDNAYINNEELLIEGDSMYYDRSLNYGQSFYNVTLTDTIEDMIIKGHYGEFNKFENNAFVTDSAYAILIDREDSLFIHGDTLWMFYNNDDEIEQMKVFDHCKFFREDIQGKCDSLVYQFSDSVIYMFKSPILWSKDNQLTADTIYFALSNNRLDSVVMQDKAMIISLDDSVFSTYNQIKGKQIIGFYRDGEMKKIKTNGNAELVYYLREDDNSLIGVNTAISSDILIYLNDNKIETLSIISKPNAQLSPYAEITKEKQKLEGFNWFQEQRPLKMKDIFIHLD